MHAAGEDWPSFPEQTQVEESNLLPREAVVVLAILTEGQERSTWNAPASPDKFFQANDKLLEVAVPPGLPLFFSAVP